MVAERIEGAYATLERLTVNHVKQVHERLQDPAMYLTAGMVKPPTLDDVKADLLEEEIFLFDVIPDTSDQSVAYAGVVFFSGPPYVFFQPFSDQTDMEMAQEAVLNLVHTFFQHSTEEELWTYVPKPVPEEAHDMLVEGGFDPYMNDVLPGVDLDKTAAYLMERHTYEAYWGEGSEDPEI